MLSSRQGASTLSFSTFPAKFASRRWHEKATQNFHQLRARDPWYFDDSPLAELVCHLISLFLPFFIILQPQLVLTTTPDIWRYWKTGAILILSVLKSNPSLGAAVVERSRSSRPGSLDVLRQILLCVRKKYRQHSRKLCKTFLNSTDLGHKCQG